MHIATSANSLRDSMVAARTAARCALDSLGRAPQLLFAYATANHDFAAIAAALSESAPGVPMHGSSSCGGVMTERGFCGEEGWGLGVLALADAAGSFGVGAAAVGDDPREAGAQALLDALAVAKRSGEAPDLVWLSTPPGNEEQILDGIVGVVGREIPIVGGSSADERLEGAWRQLAMGSAHRDAVVATVLFPSEPPAFAFHSGYTATEHSGRVTSATGRLVKTIDGRRAADVYNEWTDGLISDELAGGRIFSKTTLAPVGRVFHAPHGVEHYLLAHPLEVTEEGALTLFAAIADGERVFLMRGSVDGLVTRAGRVARAALEANEAASFALRGALVIFCAGCMLAVRARIGDVVDGVRDALRGKPFLGAFTFGEQGCFVRGDNRHSNLMISVVTFGATGHA